MLDLEDFCFVWTIVYNKLIKIKCRYKNKMQSAGLFGDDEIIKFLQSYIVSPLLPLDVASSSHNNFD